LNAAGTVHHIAFEVPDDEALRDFQVRLFDLGLSPTPIIDRYYFHSVYFRTPAGILFELATSGPGFVADESPETLGEELALPPFLEPHRSIIEAGLIPLETKE
jgi:glyoxalase family protein